MNRQGKVVGDVQGRAALGLMLAVVAWALPGCAAFHPIRGIPARYIPAEYRGTTQDDMRTIDLSVLVQPHQGAYRLGPGDVISVYIPGILGEIPEQLGAGDRPPVNPAWRSDLPPTIGFPLTVDDDGSLTLPQIGRVPVNGLTLKELQHSLIDAMTRKKKLVNESESPELPIVTLMKPRQYRVLVVRQEQSQGVNNFSQIGTVNLGASRRGTSRVVSLPAYENDVLHALSRLDATFGDGDGLPGLEAENAIYIIRRRGGGRMNGTAGIGGELAASGHRLTKPSSLQLAGFEGKGHRLNGPIAQTQYLADGSPVDGVEADGNWGMQHEWQGMLSGFDPGAPGADVVRIPVRLHDGESLDLSPEDVLLQDGDIVFIEARDTSVFYTGGLLGGGQFTIPRDYDITVTEAIAISQTMGGQRGGGGSRAIGGVSALNQDVTISASRAIVRRKLTSGQTVAIEVDLYRAKTDPVEDIRVLPGDYIYLQYSKAEAVAAFLERHLLEGALLGIAAGAFNGGSGGGQ